MYQKFIFLLPITLSLLLSACGGGDKAAAHEAETNAAPIFVKNGCIACHVVEPGGEQQLAPSLVGLATRSPQTIAGPNYTGNADTVEAYIRESILDPEIYIVEGYTPLMPKIYAASLSEQELAELVDYLLTLR